MVSLIGHICHSSLDALLPLVASACRSRCNLCGVPRGGGPPNVADKCGYCRGIAAPLTLSMSSSLGRSVSPSPLPSALEPSGPCAPSLFSHRKDICAAILVPTISRMIYTGENTSRPLRGVGPSSPSPCSAVARFFASYSAALTALLALMSAVYCRQKSAPPLLPGFFQPQKKRQRSREPLFCCKSSAFLPFGSKQNKATNKPFSSLSKRQKRKATDSITAGDRSANCRSPRCAQDTRTITQRR